MEEIKIEKGISVPPIAYSGGRIKGGGKYKYPWWKMVTGDSFFTATTTLHAMSSAASRASSYTNGRRFIVRTVEGGTRVWRIK